MIALSAPAVRRLLLASALSVAASAMAFAAPVSSPGGDPLPAGGIVPLAPTFTTVFGDATVTLENFSLSSSTQQGATQTFDYTADAHVIFSPGSLVADLAGTIVLSVFGRSDLAQAGTFTVAPTEATFSGVISGHNVNVTLKPGQSSGSTIFASAASGLYADTSLSLSLLTSVDAARPSAVLLSGATQAAVPELSTWAMMAAGFSGLALAGWRKTRRTAALA